MKKEKDFYQISLKVILKNKKGEILILKAAKSGRFAGLYDLAGGRIDTDEFLLPFSEIIKREFKEEIGNVRYKLNPYPVAIVRDGPRDLALVPEKGVRILYVFFEASYLNGEIKISDEHLAYRWVNLEKVDLAKLFTPEFSKGIEMYLAHKKHHS